VITVFTTLAFLPVAYRWTTPSPAVRNLMCWGGSRAETQKRIDQLRGQLAEIKQELHKQWLAEQEQRRWWKPTAADQKEPENIFIQRRENELDAAAREMLPSGVGFRWYQPLTSAFLHGGFFHLAGNLLFLLIFGLRVNELIGNVKMALLYPLLAMAAGVADVFMSRHQPFHPSLGASGAIMGLAGMYFVFFPVQKVHVAIWLRVYVLKGCFYKIFRIRGFWFLLALVAYHDLLPLALQSHDHIGHWAHLGGFISGAALALILLMTRQVKAGGADVISVALGPRAWGLVGRPA
jgi:membrane associated rhomboid family serine protease